MHGLMMDMPLLISDLIRHADRHHGAAEIVSKTVEDGGIHRYTYREAHRRARRLANALKSLGVGMHDRVATLAWNGYRHFEIYYAVAGSGAVIHTINPRLFPDQIAYIANHAEDKVVFFDLTFAPLVEKLAPQLKSVKHFVAMTDRAHMPKTSHPRPALLRGARSRRQSDELRMAELRREHRRLPVLHLGHHRQSEGRALHPPLDGAARVCRGAARRAQRLGARRDAAGGADVPRQRLGHAVRCALVGAKLVFPGQHLDGKSLLRAVRERGGHDERRRAHGVAGPAQLHEGAASCSFTTLKRVVIGGSACPPAMIRAFQDDYGVEVLHAWGMTEMSPLGTVCTLQGAST